ncbi:MAG: ATP-binding protein [Chloroflexales bacterium]|nr:ATP-binding protein [Chloroflexales bacterium]
MEQQIVVPAEWDSIKHLIAFTDATEHCLKLSPKQSYLLRLVVEEIATNIIKYSYADDTTGVIELICSCNNDTLRVIIRDHGRPFDPRDQALPDLGDDLASRTVGGLGVFLVREFADDLEYHHDPESGWNELVVIKGLC